MKINYKDYNIEELGFCDTTYHITKCELIDRVNQRLKLYIDNVDEFYQKMSNDVIEVDIVNCKTVEGENITLYNCVISKSYLFQDDNFIEISFSAVINQQLNSKIIMCNSISIQFVDGFSYAKKIFKFESFELDGLYYSILREGITIKSLDGKLDSNILFNKFLVFYEYIELLLGYFPDFSCVKYYDGDIEYIFKFNLSDKYISKLSYSRHDEVITNPLQTDMVKKSLKKFSLLYDNSKVALDFYHIAKSESNTFIDIAVTDVLKSIDGIFYKISYLNENYGITFDDKIKEDIIDTIKKCDLGDNKKYLSDDRIEDFLCFINKPSIRKKIDKFFRYSDNVFLYEINNEYYKTILNKMVASRHKLSHNEEKDDALSELECICYIDKLILAFRIVIMKEIGIEDYFNEYKLSEYIKNLNDYISEKLH